MRRENSVATPALYDGIAATPGPLTDDPNYNVSSLNNPVCLAQNFAAQAGERQPRLGLLEAAQPDPGRRGLNVPLFLTQGLTENNTVADGLQQYLDNHTGYERAWLGPWEHVRGNETDPDTGRLKMGRAGWFDEVMRFYDRFLKGIRPTVEDPPIAVQTNDGKWRAEAKWPPADTHQLHDRAARRQLHRQRPVLLDRRLRRLDADLGVWTISSRCPTTSPLGLGHAVDVSTTLPKANLVVDVYDLDRTAPGR